MPDDPRLDEEIADDQYTPERDPKSARAWLALITQAEKVFGDYHDRCDNIDKQYANLERLANTARDRQMQMFWANIAVLGPSIYSRPPVPVVVPRFRDRRPLLRVASELLERAAVVAFEIGGMDRVMRLIRDDLVVLARGVPWLRYEEKDGERVVIEHLNRRDFLHDPSRTWAECDWVARRAWMTRKEMRKRFRRDSGDAYQDAAFAVRKDENDNDDGRLKAGVWEIWSKSHNRVVWVSEGVRVLLDDDEPHLTLEGFFPCPQPAYSTVQRGSLIPVPDMLFYKDQLEEINELTARISALTESMKLRGFYPSGAGEIGDAVEAAIKNVSDNTVLIPVSNWSLLGGGAAKDMIVWLPLRDVSMAIKELVALRKKIIDDVYQITGLSDIMRGSTDPNETLGAQEMKSQYGSVRVRDRQDELIRIARDTTRLAAEIMAENFSSGTLLEMTQMDIPSDRDIAKQQAALKRQMDGLAAEINQARTDPEIQAMAKQNPQVAQQTMDAANAQMKQLNEQMGKLAEQPTIEKVMKLLRDQRTRPFMLDIETDSTIAPDENATKQRATEFITAVGGFMAQVLPMVQQFPQAAALAAESLKYVASQFRAGRELQTVIEEFAEQMKMLSTQPAPKPGEADAAAQTKLAETKAKIEEESAKLNAALKEQEAKANQERGERELQAKIAAMQADDQRKQSEAEIRVDHMNAARADAQAKHQQDMERGGLEIAKLHASIEQTRAQTKNAALKTDADIAAREAASAEAAFP